MPFLDVVKTERRRVMDAKVVPATTITIPVEIQELIIDELCDDNLALSACSYVCSHWRHHSYSHIFADIRVTPISVTALSALWAVPFSSAAIFFRVRRIHLVGALLPDAHPMLWDSYQLSALYDILRCLTRVANVQILILEKLSLSLLGPKITSLISQFGTLHAMKISYISFMDQPAFFTFMAKFASLRSAIFQDIAFNTPQGSFIVGSESPLALGGSCALSLHASGPFLVKNLKWMCPEVVSDESRLQLSLLGAQTAKSSDASALVRALGPNLHLLNICSGLDVSSDDIIASLDLSYCTSLRHLNLYCPGRVLGLISWLPTILNKINSPELRTIEISFASSRQFHLDEPYLKYLASILSKPQFKGLELIHLVAVNGRCDAQKTAGVVAKCVRTVLGPWEQKGVLKFSFKYHGCQ